MSNSPPNTGHAAGWVSLPWTHPFFQYVITWRLFCSVFPRTIAAEKVKAPLYKELVPKRWLAMPALLLTRNTVRRTRQIRLQQMIQHPVSPWNLSTLPIRENHCGDSGQACRFAHPKVQGACDTKQGTKPHDDTSPRWNWSSFGWSLQKHHSKPGCLYLYFG